jgi:hypothetical protein
LPLRPHLKDVSFATAVIYIIYTTFTPKIQRKIEKFSDNKLLSTILMLSPDLSISPSDNSIATLMQKPHLGLREKSNPGKGGA